MLGFFKRRKEEKDMNVAPVFTDADLGISPSKAERESVILEKKQESANRDWHNISAMASPTALDAFVAEQIKRRGTFAL